MNRRNTIQKQIVLDVVNKRHDHPSAEQIYEDVVKAHPRISLATVYRNLSVLSDEGKILRISLSDSDRFDFNISKHNHFYCESCGKVYDVDFLYDESLDDMEISNGFYIRTHQTIFKGLCSNCLNKNLK